MTSLTLRSVKGSPLTNAEVDDNFTYFENTRMGVSVLDYGADPTGVADSQPAFALAIATGSDVYVPKGTFKLNSGVTLGDDQTLFGSGYKSDIRYSADSRCVTLGHRSTVRDLRFQGDGIGGGKTLNTGVYGDLVVGWLIENCYFVAFGGAAQEAGGGAICINRTDLTHSDGGRISNCYVRSNACGINLPARAEYVVITGCLVGTNTVGFYISAGNTNVTGCNIRGNTTGVKIRESTNSGHAYFTGCQINHNTTNLDLADNINGYGFTGCEFYAGDVTLANCIGTRFVNCDFGGPGTLTLTGTVTDTLISSSRWPIAPTSAALTQVLNGNTLTLANNQDF